MSSISPSNKTLATLLENSNDLLKKVHKSSNELLETCEGQKSNFRFIHVVLYGLFFIGGCLLGYFYFSYRRNPIKDAFYNKYPSSLLGDSDVF